MELILSVEGRELATIPITPGVAKNPASLVALKRMLHMQNRLVIASYRKRPTYYIKATSKVNKILGK